MIYSQKDENWRDRQLGDSGLTCGQFGCVATAVAQALTDAGWEVTPAALIDALNARGGFTDHNHPQGAGLIIWSKVEEIYPQFHFGGEGYTFQKGVWGRYNHWILKDAEGIKDPWTGTDTPPVGFVEITGSRSAAIDPVPQPEPVVEEAPVEIPVEVWPKTVEALENVHVRTEPNTQATLVNPDTHQPVAEGTYAVISKGHRFQAVGLVEGEDVEGDNMWWVSEYNHYVSRKYAQEVKE